MGHTLSSVSRAQITMVKLKRKKNSRPASLIWKDVAEDGGVAEEGVDLEGVGHVEGEERHQHAARWHHHSKAS